MKTNRIIDLSKTGYCQPGGLGAGSDQCKCRIQQSEKRIASGGPGIAEEMFKDATPTEPGLLIPDSVNSKEKLSAFLIASGYVRGSVEYLNFYQQYGKGLQSECSYL
jgi:hypothetical protein